MLQIAINISSAFLNDNTYVTPKVPTMFSALTLSAAATNPAVYGPNTNAYVLETGQIVEIVLNNNDPGKHPFHLHGHNFQVVSRSDEDAGFFNGTGNVGTPDVPMRRDTIMVRPNGNLRIRFVADNPGIWLFHCHIEWYVKSFYYLVLLS
jgi:iron transport multicopper oxidase